ncbi:MAG TPA: hypothetical protein VE221_05650 [Sphingomicrobium sp.]|nr:hypothetical protein [Sphingomicrobium sp.]
MTSARRRVLISIAAAFAAAVAIAFMFHLRQAERIASRPPAQRPSLLLLTSLPLVFGEHFSLQGTGSPALTALDTRYRVVPISVADAAELRKGRLLLMAHPLAQPAEDLVALDQWVRNGGRVLLFADPMLEWPSSRRLGDPLRPPPMFMDTGLLAHWGLRLDAPDVRGPKVEKLGGYEVLTVSPGSLYGGCAISADRLVAHCRIGKGAATIVADADLLNVQDLGRGAAHNIDGLLSELARLERM